MQVQAFLPITQHSKLLRAICGLWETFRSIVSISRPFRGGARYTICPVFDVFTLTLELPEQMPAGWILATPLSENMAGHASQQVGSRSHSDLALPFESLLHFFHASAAADPERCRLSPLKRSSSRTP